ncbi:hypothetical protein P154DRAFT_495470 [Amniculicola lignicola CBS 123094]|uniref:P-loop containing nucleoside triphosphate hydrolase protein n=1 Tax=Amniculicola lignicola CBS 123094 TaxID=1392246 RepID=A0A6A5W942_9PLEO|nr:hypothetical protein P154DRAFT_495470 [Amniculicola lignicola CBS 123094]
MLDGTMHNKPIFVATHPRACSTAFERVFMTRRDALQTCHEPFGDAYYFGPERLAERYEDDKDARIDSGYADYTYKTIFDEIQKENAEGRRIFIKDMAQYWIPPSRKPASIAPSLVNYKRGVGTNTLAIPEGIKVPAKSPPYPYPTKAENRNPTVVPEGLLESFHFTFLIRHPRSSIPSYYRCTVPPLDKVTGFYNFRPDEAGYEELRALFDHLRDVGQIGPDIAGSNGANGTHGTNGEKKGVEICVIDADDLLDNPSGIIEAYCKSIGYPYDPDMLKWDGEEHHEYAKAVFEKWKGFHDDAINSKALNTRTHKKIPKSEAELFEEWKGKFGEEGARVIRDTVAANVADYEYLKQFAIKVPAPN